MAQEQGVPPSGPGHSAEPGPISVVPAETASVPNAAFTPGPWEVALGVQHKHEFAIEYRDSFGLRNVLAVTRYVPETDAGATARVIAAAPELLETLSAIVPVIEGAPEDCMGGHCDPETGDLQYWHRDEWLSLAKAALAKARGEQVSA